MKQIYTSSILLALLSLSLPAQDKAPKHLLRYSFKEGTQTQYLTTMHAKTSTKVQGQDMGMDIVSKAWSTFKVAAVKDGKAQLLTEIKRIKMSMNNPMMGEMEFDSEDGGDAPAMLGALNEVVGVQTKLDVDPQGRVSNMELPKQLTDGAGQQFSGASHFDFIHLPDEPIAVGSTWKTDLDLGGAGAGGGFKGKATNTLVKFENGVATISMALAMEPDLPEGAPEMDIEMKKASGAMVLDLAGMQIISSKMHVEANMTMSQQGQEIVTHMNMTYSWEKVDPKAMMKVEKKAEEATGDKKEKVEPKEQG